MHTTHTYLVETNPASVIRELGHAKRGQLLEYEVQATSTQDAVAKAQAEAPFEIAVLAVFRHNGPVPADGRWRTGAYEEVTYRD